VEHVASWVKCPINKQQIGAPKGGHISTTMNKCVSKFIQAGASYIMCTINLLQDGHLLKIGHETMRNLFKRLVASPNVDVLNHNIVM
jgi:hypothetical protein